MGKVKLKIVIDILPQFPYNHIQSVTDKAGMTIYVGHTFFGYAFIFWMKRGGQKQWS